MTLAIGLFLITSTVGTGDPSRPCPVQSASSAGRSIWLLCERDRLLFSGDAGASWRAMALPADTTFRAIRFLSVRRGFVAGDEGSLLRTEDGGVTWNRVAIPSTETLTDIQFVDRKGWLTGWSGLLLHSDDGGDTWQSQTTGVANTLESVYFLDSLHGWAVGWAGTILRTSDGGGKWERVRTTYLPVSLNSVYFRDMQNGWIVGFDGTILRSHDGGASWTEQTSPVKRTLTSVTFDREGRGWIAADSDLLTSTDGGSTWQASGIGDYFALVQVLPVEDTLWAIGQLGSLRRSGTQEWHLVDTAMPSGDSMPRTIPVEPSGA